MHIMSTMNGSVKYLIVQPDNVPWNNLINKPLLQFIKYIVWAAYMKKTITDSAANFSIDLSFNESTTFIIARIPIGMKRFLIMGLIVYPIVNVLTIKRIRADAIERNLTFRAMPKILFPDKARQAPVPKKQIAEVLNPGRGMLILIINVVKRINVSQFPNALCPK